MAGRLDGKVAIVTGAASRGEGVGNGKAMALLFAREGAKVILVNRSAERAETLAQEIAGEGGVASAFAGDVTLAGTGVATDSLRSLIDGNFSVWSFLANVAAPLWQGGRLRAQVSRAEAVGAEALATYANSALTAYAEVETALAAEAFLDDRERHLSTSVEQARGAERLANERYRAGLENYITVLDSQRSAVNAEGEFILAKRLRLENRVDLYLALGGGFEQLEAPFQLAERHANVE